MRSIMSDNSMNLEIDNRANLTIIKRNTAPKREEQYPGIWIVYSREQAVRVQVAHDLTSRPYVEKKSVA